MPQPPWIKVRVASRLTIPILFFSIKLKELLGLIKEHIGDEKKKQNIQIKGISALEFSWHIFLQLKKKYLAYIM